MSNLKVIAAAVLAAGVFLGAVSGSRFPKEEVQPPRGEAIGELPEGSLMMFIDNENGVYCYSYLASISCVRMQ